MSFERLSCLFLALAPAGLSAQISQSMVLESRIPTEPCGAADVWGMGNYMLMSRQSLGFSVTDLSDPGNPVTKLVRPPGYPTRYRSIGVSDIKSDGRYIYAADNITGAGAFIYDTVPNPMNPTLVSTLSSTGVILNGHNLWVDGNYLYVQNEIFDVTDKANPRHVHTITSPNFTFTHDVIVKNDRAYLSNWHNGFAIYDVTNPRIPLPLANHTYTGMRTHNLWPTDGGDYLFSTDELPGGHVRVWDISNLTAITQVGQYQVGPPDSVVHNVQVRDDLLFVSYYKEGVRVCSIADPANPVEIAYYDTYLPLTNGCHGDFTAGAWGVYGFREDVVLVGDADSGGYVLRLNPIGMTFRARAPVVSPGGTIELDFEYRNDAAAPLGAFGVMFLRRVNGAPALWTLVQEIQTLAPQQSVPHAVQIPLPVGLPTPLTLEFAGYTGLVNPVIVSENEVVIVGVQ